MPIFSVYTMESLYNPHRPSGMDTDRTDYLIPATSAKKWLTAIMYDIFLLILISMYVLFLGGGEGGSITCLDPVLHNPEF